MDRVCPSPRRFLSSQFDPSDENPNSTVGGVRLYMKNWNTMIHFIFLINIFSLAVFCGVSYSMAWYFLSCLDHNNLQEQDFGSLNFLIIVQFCDVPNHIDYVTMEKYSIQIFKFMVVWPRMHKSTYNRYSLTGVVLVQLLYEQMSVYNICIYVFVCTVNSKKV